MRKATLFLVPALLLFASAPSHDLPGQGSDQLPQDIPIQVSPQTLIMEWNTQGDPRVTVHADVSYGFFNDLVELTIWLDGIQAVYIKSDARGDLVAKFPHDEVIALLGTGYATLSLRAVAEDGTVYTGTDRVRVIAP